AKGSPPSPPGKGRPRERSRRSGKGERGNHQLYRLSITSARPNPTIGIAYPQQKVTPPKKQEVTPNPVAGSYRFHVPSIPQRAAELRQEDLGFGRCFPDAAGARTSNYTSQPHHGPKGQPPAAGIPLKSPGTNGQLHYFEFQAARADSWPSPEKSFAGASYGISVPKPSSFPEGGKAGAHGLGALSCPYPFQLAGKEPYRGDATSQEYLDVGLAGGQLAHGTFAFHSSSREWQDEGLSSYESVSPEGRLYGLPAPPPPPPPPPPPFLHPPPAPLPCCKGRSEHPADPNGALPSSGAIDQNPSTFQENQAVFPSSLHSPSLPKPAGKRQAVGKDSSPSPRLLGQSSPLRRNLPPNSLSQVHFPSKAYCSSPPGSAGPVAFETSIPTTAPTHPRLVQAWEGATKAFSPMDQNSAPYPNPVGSQFSFECQPGPEQRQHRQKNARMPWQQIHLASAMPAPNRLELSRQVTSQKVPFPLGTSEWQGTGKAQKGPPVSNSPGYHGKKLLSGESLGVQRGDPNSTGAFSKDPGSPACDSRSKALFYSMGQAGPPPPSRSSSGSALVLPPSALVAASPCESPLPSPVPNPTCGSTCSSLSPMSSSPLNPGFEDSQMSGALTPSPFFQHSCHPKDGNKTFHPSDVLSSSSLHYHPPDSIKSFHFPPDALKDDNLLKCSPASPFHKPSVEVTKGCSDGLDGEQPPPPYSSHHLLASSLSSASLDQLDVLLTCKQCDQNYSNLSSFLQHRQFCASHPTPQGEGKDAPRAAEGRKALPPEPPKPPSLGLSPDPHFLALNKSDDFLLDGESKSEGKEDALKGGLFNGLTTSSLPLTASDLDIDDAKLDSLITEALNGLGYQSDNPEIDSSFIDVFADEELTGTKAAGGGMSHKVKEALALESKSKQAAAEEKAVGQVKAGYFYEDGHLGEERVKRGAGKQHLHKGRAARRLAAQEADPGPEGTQKTGRLRAGRKNNVPPATTSSRSTSSQKHPRKLSQEPPTKSEVGPGVATKSSKPPRFSMKDMKKRKPRSGTWSKELIHKIVQQKNKLHKLQVKSSKQPHKKRPGRRERVKEKDPAWSYSQKRDGQKREAPEHGVIPSQRDAEKEECVTRARRRSSQSSTSSNHSGGVPSEVGTSPPHADGTSSSSEKGGTQRRRRSGSSPRTPLSLPEDRSPRKSQKSKEDVPKGSRRFGSARPLLAGSRTRPSTELDVAVVDCAKEEALAQPQEGQLPGVATSGRSPIGVSCKEGGAEDPKGAAKQVGEAVEPTLQAQDPPELAVVNQRHRFAPFTSDGLKYHAAELLAPSHGGKEGSPGNAAATYSEGGIKYVKGQGLCEGRKDYPVPVAPYGGDGVGMMLTAKAPDPYVSSNSSFFDPKGLPGHYEDNLFSKPPALGSSHMDDMYLCRDDINATSFEQKHASISPYATETPQGKVSSPLSFDSSSIFGELPVTEFDPPLYEGVPATKDGYVTTFTCPGNAPSKTLPFEQPYPPFMPEKDWSLMEEVAPMLPEDMTQFHSLSVEKPLAKEGPVPTSQLSLPLPDRITDYNVTFMNNISDDELEIKRLVTELESQLQTSKLDNEASVTLQKPELHVAAHLRGPAGEHFPPLQQEPGQEKGLFLGEELGGSRLCVGERMGGEKPATTSARGDYESSREPWPCPVELGSLEAGMCSPAQLTGDRFCSKDGAEQLQGAVAPEERDPGKIESGASSKSLPGSRTPDHAETPLYTDPVTKSPPVVTNTMFPKALEAAEATKDARPCQHHAESFPVPGKADESFSDAAELEKFDAHLPNHKPEFGFQQGPTPALDLPFSPHIKEVPDTEERPLGKPESPKMVESTMDFKGDGDGSALVEETEERKSPTNHPAPGPGDKASKQKVLLFDMLSLPKETNCNSQQALASQETSANPLQQLQLFVARTVKSNEEELLMPCFPVLLAPNHPSATTRGHPEQKEESGGALEGENQTYCPARGEENVPSGGTTENIAAPAKEVVLFSGGHEQLGVVGSYHAKQPTPAKLELQNNAPELQHLANEPSEPSDINIPADGVSRERRDLSPVTNTAVTPPPGQGKKAEQLLEELEQDKTEATSVFKKHEQSHVNHRLLQEEPLGSTAAEGNQVGQPLHSAPASPTSPPGPSKEDLQQDHCLVPEVKASTISVKVPREGTGKKKSPNGCHYTGEPPANLPLPTNFSPPKCLQSGGAEGGEVLGIGTQLSDEKKYSMSLLNAPTHGQDCGSPPFNQQCVGKEVPESVGSVLSSPHLKDNQACTTTDTISNSIPPETQGYPTQPTTDLLPVREREEENQENKLESCSDDGNQHQSEPETLSDGFVAQQVPAALSRGLTRTGDLGPAELSGHEFSETAEVKFGLSKATESGGKGLKGEKPKSHGAGEAGSCVLNRMGQGEDIRPNSAPNPSQNELPKEKKPNGLPVTCDICSATFRSKPGLTRHKAVKHQVKNGGGPQPSKTSRSALLPADKTSKAAQKVPRRSLKTLAKDKTSDSQMPTTDDEHVPKKTCPNLEKEPNAQMQEVVSRVLSDLSVISFKMSQELHCTRVLQREVKVKGPRSETRGAGEVVAGKLDLGRQARKGEKGRRNPSRDPGEVDSSSGKKLNRKVRRRKAKVFPSRNEPNGPCELEKNADPPPDVLGSSLPKIMEGLNEPGGCISTEEQNPSNSTQDSQKAEQSPCAAELAEDLGDRMVSSKEMGSKELVMGMVTCPGEVEDPNGEDEQACKQWVSGFVKQVEKGLGKVGKEQRRGGDGTEEMDAEPEDSPAAGSGAGNQSRTPQGLMAPAEEDLLLETCDSETTQKVPGHDALQTPAGTSPPPAEPKRWVKVDVPPGREHGVESTAVSGLQSLFDDDSSFSELFPRDEQFVRRKCTRVYGKRSKKPKPTTEVTLQPAGAMDLFTIQVASDLSESSSFCVTREDPCEYETISVDDALMLNMCHSSKAKGGDAAANGPKSIVSRLDHEKTDQGKEDIDLEDNMLTFLCQNSQVDSVTSLNIWGSLEKEGESLSAEDMFEPLMDLGDEHSLREVSSEPPDLAEEPYSGKPSEDPDSPEFHTIDIEMLNAKLKMRDMCFFGPCEDLPGHGEDNAVAFKPRQGQHGKHRSKLEDGKLGKNRSEITIKSKDKQYKCKVCFQWFLTLGELDFHKLSHNPSPPPTCYMCVQRKFSSREQLRDHLKEKHAKNKAGLWACGMCLKEISDVWMYNEHLREHATQFARKGQAQKSVMGLPACFGEDNAAVTHFLNTIMYRKPSRSSRHADPKHVGSRESKSPREPPLEQEAKAMKDPMESNVKVKPPAGSSSKASFSPSPEHVAKSEGPPKSVPMHPDCKDPSRDCHHCGKQFPKPFKLQRHLVVHSLQKIYLCHKCPMFYQETKELRSHLSQEHGIVEEQEIKHTTLYACELCADVMHVIKKSFICSMCNYTFSKKEQYDRHMEKHLAGSNKTFKFRGVMRPGGASREGREKVKEDGSPREGMPPSKRRKVAHHGSSPVHLDHTSDLQLVEAASPSLQPPTDSFPTASGDPGGPQPSMKTEELVGDFSDLLVEMERSQFDTLPPPPCLSPSLPQAVVSSPELGHITALDMEELEKGEFDGKPLPFLDSHEFTIDLGVLENPSGATDAVDGIPFLQLAEKVSGIPSPQAEAPPAKETHKWGNPSASNTSSWEGASQATSPEAAHHHPLPLKDKTASPTLNRAAKESVLQKKTSSGQPSSEAAPSTGSPGSSTEEGQQPIVGREKAMLEVKDSSTNTKDQGGNPSKSTSHQPRGEAATTTMRHGHVEPSKATSKLHPKRRKEHKSLGHRSSSGSRENMEGDGKKKKARTPCPGRSESSSDLKRSGWSNAEASALSPGRKETHCNKLSPKPKAGPQLKKMVLDTYNQKKGELRHANGDVKRRKAILGKSLHQVLAKGPAPSPRGSLHTPRPTRGAKVTSSTSYRTAESQNNLLSQLFGQKLTSFKIPLRRDTSE
ncbi:ZN469 protein, partial [Brachypteracias leptosomus]|nr:ZN469 protein [Brachypteracias leptosomus]